MKLITHFPLALKLRMYGMLPSCTSLLSWQCLGTGTTIPLPLTSITHLGHDEDQENAEKTILKIVQLPYLQTNRWENMCVWGLLISIMILNHFLNQIKWCMINQQRIIRKTLSESTLGY
jgi:hypothetical protein